MLLFCINISLLCQMSVVWLSCGIWFVFPWDVVWRDDCWVRLTENLKLFNSVWLVLSKLRGKAVCDILIVKLCFICWKRRSSKSYLNNLVWDMFNYWCVSILSNIYKNTVTNVVRPRLRFTLVNRSRIVSWSFVWLLRCEFPVYM